MREGSVGLLEVFLVVATSTLFSIGGGNGPIAFMQDRWVTPGFLEPSLFAWALALGHLTPGPNAGFLAAIGYYMYGIPGAMVAAVAVIVPTAIGAAAVTIWFAKLQRIIKLISLPAGFVIAGMIAAAAWQLAKPMHLSVPELAGVCVAALLIAWRNLSPVLVILGSACVGFLIWLAGAYG